MGNVNEPKQADESKIDDSDDEAPKGLPSLQEQNSASITARTRMMAAHKYSNSVLITSTTVRSSGLPPLPPSPKDVDDSGKFELPALPTIQDRAVQRSRHRARQSSVLNVSNGVTGTFISPRIAKIAARFWAQNIDPLSHADQLEVSCSIFFSMLGSSDEVKRVMKSNLAENAKIEATSLKYLDMLGWLIRHLTTDKIDLFALLGRLGTMHQALGVKINHFTPMLRAMHETFSYYFERKYTIEVKYAFEEIFALAAQIMTGDELVNCSYLMNINQQFQGNDIPFLKDLDICLQSEIGREYLFRFLTQTWCDEIVIFLKLLARFKKLPSNKERFMVAREINKTSIEPTAEFSLNISFETRCNMLAEIKVLDKKFMLKEALEIPVNLFEDAELEVFKLIRSNQWNKFVDSIYVLQTKSFNVQ